MEKEKNRKRKIQKLIWFDEREVAQIKLKMAQAGTTNFSDFTRKMLMEGEVKVIDLSGILELKTEVNKIGVNINQIVRLANTSDEVKREEVEVLKIMLKDIKNLFTEQTKFIRKES